MISMRLLIVWFVVLGLPACGGSVDLTCDELRAYQLAGESKRVDAPDDLDDLDPLRELPLPKASPQSLRQPGSPCIDRPPPVKIGG